MIPNESRARSKPETSDVAGAVTVTAGLLVLVYAIVKAQELRLGLRPDDRPLRRGVALLVAFVVIELRSQAPLIRLGIFRIALAHRVANVAMLLVASGLFAMFFFASLYVQQLLGYSPIKAGLAFLPFTLGIVIGAGARAAADQALRRAGGRGRRPRRSRRSGMLLYTQLPLDGTYLGRPASRP